MTAGEPDVQLAENAAKQFPRLILLGRHQAREDPEGGRVATILKRGDRDTRERAWPSQPEHELGAAICNRSQLI